MNVTNAQYIVNICITYLCIALYAKLYTIHKINEYFILICISIKIGLQIHLTSEFSIICECFTFLVIFFCYR